MDSNTEKLMLAEVRKTTEYEKVYNLWNETKSDAKRSEWELWYDVGKRIMKSNLKNGVFGDAKVERRFVNFVNKNLRRKLSEIRGAGIEVEFEKESIFDDDSSVVAEALEMEVMRVFKDFDILDIYNNILIYPYFYGMGWAYQGWNGREIAKNYETGIPFTEIIDPYDIYIDPNTRLEDKSDMRFLFHRRIFRVSELREMFFYNTELMEWLKDREDKEEFDLITYHFKRITPISLVGVVDNNKGTIVYFSEQEYKTYLRQEVLKLKGSDSEEFIRELENLFRDENDYSVLPEGVRFTKPLRKNVSGWYEMSFIDGFGQIGKIQYVGNHCRYIPMSALYITDSPYSMGLAYDMAEILDLHSIITTMQVIRLLKHYKLKVWFVQDGIANYQNFRNNYEDLNVNLEIDEGWLMKHPGGVPFGYIKLPQVDSFEMSLKRDLEYIINEFSNSPKVTKGIPEYNEMSNQAIMSLLHAVKQGDKSLILAYNKMLDKAVEILKEDIAKYKNYPHKVTLLDFDAKPVPIWVNKENDSISYVDISDMIKPMVEVHESDDEVTARRKMEAMQLRQMGAISEVDFLRKYGIKNIQRILENNAKEKGISDIMRAVSENPQLLPLLQDMINNPKKYIQGVNNGTD